MPRAFVVIGRDSAAIAHLEAEAANCPGLTWHGAPIDGAGERGPTSPVPGFAMTPEAALQHFAMIAEPDVARLMLRSGRFDPVAHGLSLRLRAAGAGSLEATVADLTCPDVLRGILRHAGGAPAADVAGLSEGSVAMAPGAHAGAEMAGPMPARTLATPGQAVLARQAPLLLTPVPGAAPVAGLGLLERLDPETAATRQPLADVETRLLAGQVLETGLARDALAARRRGALAVALVCHPALRMHQLFLEQAFSGPTAVQWVRRALVTRFGGIPGLRAYLRNKLPPHHDLARHRLLFRGFVDLASEELGRGIAGRDGRPAAWASQLDWLASWSRVAAPDRVIRLSRLGPGLEDIAEILGHPQPAPHLAKVLRAVALAGPFPIADVLDPATVSLIAELYPQDMAYLGDETLSA